ALTATAGSREEPSDAQLAPPGRPGARVRDLGGGGALRDAPPDPAPVRPPGPGDPAAHPGPRPPLQHPRHRTPAGIQGLSQEDGINLAGIKRILELQDEVSALEDQLSRVRESLETMTPAQRRVFAADRDG